MSATAADLRRARLLTGPVLPTLVRLAAPNVLLALMQALVSFADTWFIGTMGTSALAGVALVFPILILMQMMSAGAMGGGVSSAIARALGAGDAVRAGQLAAHAVVIGVAFGLLFTVIMLAAGPPLYRTLGGDAEALAGAIAYSTLVFGGAMTVWVCNILASVVRGTGNMIVPAVILSATALLQIPLCGALVLGWGPFPQLGIRGAGIAYVCSFGTGALCFAAYILAGYTGLTLRRSGIRLDARLFTDILGVGLLSSFNAVQTIATAVIVTGLVGHFRTAALAGYGLGVRLELLQIPVVFAIGSALVVMVGTSIGAGNVKARAADRMDGCRRGSMRDRQRRRYRRLMARAVGRNVQQRFRGSRRRIYLSSHRRRMLCVPRRRHRLVFLIAGCGQDALSGPRRDRAVPYSSGRRHRRRQLSAWHTCGPVRRDRVCHVRVRRRQRVGGQVGKMEMIRHVMMIDYKSIWIFAAVMTFFHLTISSRMVKLTELRGRRTGGGLGAVAEKAFAHVLARNDCGHVGADLLQDRGRCAGRKMDAAPRDRAVAGDAGFGDRRQFRQRLRPMLAAYSRAPAGDRCACAGNYHGKNGTEKINCTWPPITSTTAGAIPRYEMCVGRVCVMNLKSSPARCEPLPVPVEPKLSDSGRSVASAMNSFTSRAGTLRVRDEDVGLKCKHRRRREILQHVAWQPGPRGWIDDEAGRRYEQRVAVRRRFSLPPVAFR